MESVTMETLVELVNETKKRIQKEIPDLHHSWREILKARHSQQHCRFEILVCNTEANSMKHYCNGIALCKQYTKQIHALL